LLDNSGDFEGAISAWRELLVLDPGNDDVHFYVGQALIPLNRNDEALEYFRLAVGIDPDFIEAYEYIAYLLHERAYQSKSRHDWRAALLAYRRVARMRKPDAALLYRTGILELWLGDKASATKSMESAIAMDPGYGDAYVELSWLYSRTGRWLKALQTARSAVELPNFDGSKYDAECETCTRKLLKFGLSVAVVAAFVVAARLIRKRATA
jgi:tetratricopeptide (TPR) repeat protein